MALELHSFALHLYDRGGVPERAIRPADLEALHLVTLSGEGGTTLFLQCTLVGATAVRFRTSDGGDAFHLVMAETMAPWIRALSDSRSTVAGDRERFVNAWRRWVEVRFPEKGMLHLTPPPRVPPVRLAAPVAAVAKAAPKAAPKPPPKEGPQCAIW